MGDTVCLTRERAKYLYPNGQDMQLLCEQTAAEIRGHGDDTYYNQAKQIVMIKNHELDDGSYKVFGDDMVC